MTGYAAQVVVPSGFLNVQKQQVAWLATARVNEYN